MNPNKFTYKIKSYDAERKLLDVEFEDGTWARVPFIMSMPTNGEDLDKIVAQFASKTEQIAILDADDFFVRGIVGTEREADRASFRPAPQPSDPSEEPAPSEPVNPIEASEVAWVEQIVLRVLREQALIAEEAA